MYDIGLIEPCAALEETGEGTWATPAKVPSLGNHEIHLWRGRIAGELPRSEEYEATLSPGEKSAASAFRFGSDRVRYIISHGMLRKILSMYTGIDAADLNINRSEQGKPVLSSSQAVVQFSMSHTDEAAVFAVARSVPIGVDVERVRAIQHAGSILGRFLPASCIQEIASRPEAEQRRSFARWWTANEAVLKARGKGLESFAGDVDFIPEEGSCVEITLRDPGLPMTLWSFDLTPDHCGSLAARGNVRSFQCMDFSFDLTLT